MSRRRIISSSGSSTVDTRFDPNLRISVYAALIELGAVPPVTQEWVDREHPGDTGFRESLYAFFATAPIGDELFAKVRAIEIPTGYADARMAAFVSPGRERDERFRINSLVGIEQCSALERLELGDCAIGSLAPLRRLRALKTVGLSWRSRIELEATNGPLLHELVERGVRIEVAPSLQESLTSSEVGELGELGDLNLKLVIFEYLATRELLPWPDDQGAAMYRYDYEVAAKLGNLVPVALLDSVDELSVSPPLTLAQIVYPQWSGEDDEFAVRRLDGIELCTKLRQLDLTYCRVADLSPLLGLAALESVEISWHPDMDRHEQEQHRERNAKVIDKLKRHGVRVSVSW